MDSGLVDVPTAPEVTDAYLAYPAEAGEHPEVLMMDAFGLRPRLR